MYLMYIIRVTMHCMYQMYIIRVIMQEYHHTLLYISNVHY